MATRTAIINVMAKACYKASRNLLRDFGEVEHRKHLAKGRKILQRPPMTLLDESY